MQEAGDGLLQALHPVDKHRLLNKEVEENSPTNKTDIK
jgi:hypothetical protein